MPQQDPRAERLAQLAAIAQIYGAISAPQAADERASQQQLMELLRLRQAGEFQKGELAHGDAALQATKEYQAAQLAHESTRDALAADSAKNEMEYRKNALATQKEEAGNRNRIEFLSTYLRDNPAAAPADRQRVIDVTMAGNPDMQKYGPQVDEMRAQSEAPAAQTAWDKISGLKPELLHPAWTQFASEYPAAVKSGKVDYSRVPAAALPAAIAPDAAFSTGQGVRNLLGKVGLPGPSQEMLQQEDPLSRFIRGITGNTNQAAIYKYLQQQQQPQTDW